MSPNQEEYIATRNNFDLIRLFAAIQVAIAHTSGHLNIDLPGIFAVLGYFPGVPIFFFISGFLIYNSYANIKGPKWRVFFTNRFLRLYPGLIGCFFVTLLSLIISGYLQTQTFTAKDFGIWVLTSVTFFQFYNPDFLRDYGVGAINGSLWTISVELQFYLLTPLLFIALHKHRSAAVAVAIALVIANMANTFLNESNSTVLKLVEVSFVPWFYMFMLGAIVSTRKSLQEMILSVNAVVYLVLYLTTYVIAAEYNLGTGNGINFISYLLLCCVIFRLAYTKSTLSRKLLGGNDISYGIYIYHMPVVNLWLFSKIQGTPASFVTAMLSTIGIAVVSWYLVEKPALKLKKIAQRSYT